jgi:hypothetical protein
MDALDAALAAVVTYRLWRLVAVDSITAPWRRVLRERRGTPLMSWCWEGLTCPWCASIWIGGPVALWAWLGDGDLWWEVPAVALSASAAAGFLHLFGAALGSVDDLADQLDDEPEQPAPIGGDR